jgi:hypothetical protein
VPEWQKNNMKIYKITFNKCGYDQFDSFIVCAKDETDVIKVIKKEHPRLKKGKNYLGEEYEIFTSDISWGGGYIVEEVKLEKGIILGSYNAG